jgi:AraC family transcriptional regulator
MPLQHKLTRIEKVLDYIHEHLDESIHVASLAEKSCWSRWQFQRVFGEATGLTVAQYIRELRLSKAAELLLSSPKRHIDIAILCGFDSEISFSRAFKNMFNCTPREYRLRGKRQGLRTPLQYRTEKTLAGDKPKAFTQIRIESRDAFQLNGVHGWIHGPFSSTPDFIERVPQLWKTIDTKNEYFAPTAQPIGIIDTHYHPQNPDQMCYWAGYLGQPKNTYATIYVPSQEYAVIPVHGKVAAVEQAVEWFIHRWLPESDYDGISGYELEVYDPHYDPKSSQSYMEYWLPIKPR